MILDNMDRGIRSMGSTIEWGFHISHGRKMVQVENKAELIVLLCDCGEIMLVVDTSKYKGTALWENKVETPIEFICAVDERALALLHMKAQEVS